MKTDLLRAKILELEEAARRLEPTAALRSEWHAAVQAYADAFLDAIEEAPGYEYDPREGQGIEAWLPAEEGKPISQVLRALEAHVDHCGINPASGGHLGYIPGGGVFPSALGDYLAAITNRYAGIYFANPGAVRMENMMLRWLCRLVGYPEGALGNLTSGGSVANLIGIVTARDAKGVKSAEVPRSVIYLSEQVHHSVHKAIRIAGLGEAPVRYVPLDDHYRLDAEALALRVERDRQAGLRPFLVIASAGTTDTGAMDPLDAIAEVAQAHDMWFHVDAAYGGFFILLDELKARFKGLERSDSLAIDPHKGLFLPYGLGAVLVKDVQALMHSHFYRAHYMQDALENAHQLSPADLSPELTKHFRGLRLWLPLQLLGLAPFRAALAEKRALAQYFHREVQRLGFEVGPPPDLSVVIYRYAPRGRDANAFNRRLTQYVQRDGRVFVSSTTIEGQVWLRLACLSFRTHLKHIDTLLEVLQAGVRHLLREAPSASERTS